MKTKLNSTRTIFLSLAFALACACAVAGQPPTVRPLPQKQLRQSQPAPQKRNNVQTQRPQRQSPHARVVSPRNNGGGGYNGGSGNAGGGGGYTRPDNTASAPNTTTFKPATPVTPPYPGVTWSAQRTPPTINEVSVQTVPQAPLSPVHPVPGAGVAVQAPAITSGVAVVDRVPVAFTEFISATDQNLQAEADLLREAYITMSKASHIYRGHRWHAMIQTSRAGAILGIRLCGDGRGNTTRQISDQMLRDARAILQRVHPMLVTKNKPLAAQHVQNAINQLNLALATP